MMNGREKSDSAIVAVKPTNKAERSAAEPVEPRAGTEGNAGQQSTRRAQDRGSVSQALDRIRKVARQRKKEKFTTLFHHLDVTDAAKAFRALKRDAAPGVDGLTWEDYEADLDARSKTCTRGFIEERTGRCRAGGVSYPSRTDGSARWRSPRSKTRLSRGRRRRC